jgi:hypothetical protein
VNVLIFATLLAVPAPVVEVQALDSGVVLGPLVELSSGRLTIETSQGRVSLETEKLLGISPKQKPAAAAQAPAVWIELVDGSALVAQQVTVHDGQARITLDGGNVV